MGEIIEILPTTVKPQYKRVKMLMPHCPNCKEMLSGNNSISFPWECSCGIWVSEFQNPGEYEIMQKDNTVYSI